jgi:hypothetical protein
MELKVFLSHRYESPEVNLYFHEVFAEVAAVQFDVDIGRLPTNVTRLERMIRDADAFVGIYPYPGDPGIRASLPELRDASKYFRLEMDLAIRSRKPSLIFFDRRYSQLFRFPKAIHAQAFDIQEIVGQGRSPQRALFRRTFENFCEEVKATMAAGLSRPLEAAHSEVGLLVPDSGVGQSAYAREHTEAVEEVLNKYGFTRTKRFRWPPQLDTDCLTDIEALDWVIAEVGPAALNSGIVGYLHGRFVPTMRLQKAVDGNQEPKENQSYLALYGGVEVGYRKDIIAWNDPEFLKVELDKRLFALTAPVRRIGSRPESEAYFREASLRKEFVFLSYSGKDVELASQLSAELKKRFQKVFDYKDGESITPGEPWLKEIFDKLSNAALGIPLVSLNYLQSGNCDHEAQEMIARRDSGKMAVIPLKLYRNESFDPPSWFGNRQYMHIYDYPDVPTTVNKLIEFFDRATKKST